MKDSYHRDVKISLHHYYLGWEWLINHTMYRTNSSGDGLWELRQSIDQFYSDGSPFYEYKQVEGTCQFSLVRCTYDQAYHRIARYFAKFSNPA